MIKISIDGRTLGQAQLVLGDSSKQMRIAVSRTINDTLKYARQQISLAIKDEYTAQAKALKAGMPMKKAKNNSLYGDLRVKGSPVPLGSFKLDAKGTKKIKMMRAKVKKRSRLWPVEGLFVRQSARSEYKGAMMRMKSTAYPLRIPYGPSVPQMVGSEETLERIVPRVQKHLDKRLDHHVNHQITNFFNQ